jgi:hypothetical protein
MWQGWAYCIELLEKTKRHQKNYRGPEKYVGAVCGSYGVDTNWYTDSGATNHITGELEKLHEIATTAMNKFTQLVAQVWIYIILVTLSFIPLLMICILKVSCMFLKPQKVFSPLVA